MRSRIILLLLALCVTHAQARILRWQVSKMGSTTYDILNTKSTNTFLQSSNWRVVDPLTGEVTSIQATPANYDTLQIYGASLTLSVNFDMTFLEYVVLDFGDPRSGVTYSLKVKRDNEWLLSSTSTIIVRSGDLIAERDNFGCINTGIKIGGEYKLMAVDCAEAIVRPFTFASKITPVTVTIVQEGFISGTLAVSLDDFEAIGKNGDAHLSWKTRQETNSRYFMIERSSDAISYTTIAQIPAAGQSSIERSYSYIDRQVPTGIVYYRIRVISGDESLTLSSTRPVRISSGQQRLGIYPHPVQSQAYLWYDASASRPRQWQLFNRSGQLLYVRQLTSLNSRFIELNLGDVPTGQYILIIQFEDGSRQQASVTVVH